MTNAWARQAIETALAGIYAEDHLLWNEDELEAALSKRLGDCDRSKGGGQAPLIPFESPNHPPPHDEKLPRTGTLDILWRSDLGPVCIELKLCKKDDGADHYAYGFLLDIHRLERMRIVVDANLDRSEPVARFALFVSHRSFWWRIPASPLNYPTVEDSRVIEGPEVIQYKQPAQRKTGSQYRGFTLSNNYEFRWRPLQNPSESRFLLACVDPQAPD